jgi:DNA-binding XRE family transcriptional regulator
MRYTDFMRELETDAEYQQAREALKPHFVLGDAVLRERIRRGWSQAELARKAGTRQANISRVEAGLGNPTLNLIQKLIRVLDLELHFFPAVTTTTYRSVSFGQAIPVPDWPAAQQAASTSGHVSVRGGRI